MRAHLSSIGRGLLSLVLPPACPGCGCRLEGSPRPCHACTLQLAELFRRVPDRSDPAGPIAALAYEEIARLLVHRMKYGGDRPAAEALADWMATRLTCGTGPDPATWLLPVPLHSVRLRERGFNQAERLARGVARRTGLEVRTDILRRVRAGSSQTQLDHSARSAVVAGAFIGRAGLGERPILIVDDVWTTGATASACRSALGADGATGPIGVLVAARTPSPFELETPREVC